MTPLHRGIRRIFRLDTWRRDEAERDLRDEVALHIALRAEQLVREGLPREQALAEARRRFAQDPQTLRDLHNLATGRHRHMRVREYWYAAGQDLRFAARRLGREPAITTFILVTLALGIGMNVTAFSVMDRVLLRGPQHVREPDRVVRLYSRAEQPPLGLQTLPWLPYATIAALGTELRSIEAVAAYRPGDAMLGSGAASERRRVSMANSGLFPLLGVRPVAGRFYGPDEDAALVVVLGERYWRAVLGGNPAIIGTSLAVNDVAHTVVGIAPEGFTGPELGRVDAWIPVAVSARNSMNVQLVARLRPGATIESAAAEVGQRRAEIEAGLPHWAGWLRGASYLAAPIRYDAGARESFEAVMARWLAAISAIILVVNCANVANLLLARLARRRRELAVRVALGSGRGRVARLLMLEGAVLAAGAAVLSFLVIALAEPVVKEALFPGGAWTLSLLDARILAAVAGFTLATTVLVALGPAWQAGRSGLADALRGGQQAGESRSALRAGLTIAQAALSVVLLVGAGLFVQSLERVRAVDLGLDPEQVLTVEVNHARLPRNPGETFDTWLERTGAAEHERFRTLVQAVRRVPGVERAAVSVGVPFAGGVTAGLWVPGRDTIPALPGGGPYVTAADEDYFATIGTAVLRGRAFTAADREGSEPVIMVNETMARVLWPEGAVLGACVQVGSRAAPCARVVGVAADIHRSGLREQPSMQFYVPIGQERGFAGSWLLVRPRGRATADWPALRRALEQADPGIRSLNLRVLVKGLDHEMRPFRLGIVAFGLSASLALVVAGLGLYSIMAHAVAWRRREIGVRLALGAAPRAIAAMVVGRGAGLATIGIATGLVMALAARRWVEPVLFETTALDPVVLLAVVGVLEVVALLAGWWPARRAVAVSPTEALRAE